MTESDYRDWAEKTHAALFTMHSEDDKALFRAWKPVLIACDVADLRAASLWIASNRAERYRTQHLQLLQDRIRQQGFAAMQAQYQATMREADEARDRCNECGGRGMLTVPHLSQIQEGEWIPSGRTYYEAVVCCRCRLGVAKFHRYSEVFVKAGKQAPPLSIADYEMHNPDWLRQMAKRERAERAQREAVAHSQDVDRTRGPLSWIKDHAKRLITGPSDRSNAHAN